MVQVSRLILILSTAILGFFNTAFALLFGICTIMFILLFVVPSRDNERPPRPPRNTGEAAPKDY
jgi:ABC-type transport system involved in cytochrome bd biosynthesis fused ATPase/permease subunit